MFNTLHTVCFMHGLSIYEIKRIVTVLIFSESQHLTNFLKILNDNTGSKYRAETVVIFRRLLSFNLNHCP